MPCAAKNGMLFPQFIASLQKWARRRIFHSAARPFSPDADVYSLRFASYPYETPEAHYAAPYLYFQAIKRNMTNRSDQLSASKSKERGGDSFEKGHRCRFPHVSSIRNRSGHPFFYVRRSGHDRIRRSCRDAKFAITLMVRTTPMPVWIGTSRCSKAFREIPTGECPSLSGTATAKGQKI